MEIAAAARYHVERSGDGGRDLDIVFEGAPPAASATPAPAPGPSPVDAAPKPAPTSAAVTPAATPKEPSARGRRRPRRRRRSRCRRSSSRRRQPGESVEPEAPITLSQAMANVAAITPKSTPPAEQPADAMAALKHAGARGGAGVRAGPARRATRERRTDPGSGVVADEPAGAKPSSNGTGGAADLRPAARPPSRLPPSRRPSRRRRPPASRSRVERTSRGSSPATRSASTSRAWICAPSCGRLPTSAA